MANAKRRSALAHARAAKADKRTKKIPFGYITVTEAALRVHQGYQRTRNLALKGTFGKCLYDRNARELYIPEAGVAKVERRAG